MNSTIKDLMDRVNSLIKQAETKMSESHFFVETEFDCLDWKKIGSKWRIALQGKPLIEHPFEVRSEHIEALPFLVEAAKKNMIDKFSKITPERLTELSDMILDI